MTGPIRAVWPAAAGWSAFGALELPAEHPLRALVVVAFLAVGPGYALAGEGASVLTTAVTSVAGSAASCALTAEAYLLAGAFSAPRVVGTLAGLTTIAVLIRTVVRARTSREELR
ncbi:hypothetical protein [Embleya hyalina]|uniref:Uncharacterized protein n=1 Tax=Embleya hyalina TaxID=516124 RepID=A0A401Z5G5_9ACTN|nr:hypothetical protein [Embleya hyalina]GCE02104.1 hypothetical protein EHYA_09881 [Embleya hyalina]GCE02155.1 hypothetical protein EHYA_09932 [Embleya hyalina]